MTAASFREKLPSKKLDRLLERHGMLHSQLMAQAAKEYPEGATCQFRDPYGRPLQHVGIIKCTGAVSCDVTSDATGTVTVGLLDIRRLAK